MKLKNNSNFRTLASDKFNGIVYFYLSVKINEEMYFEKKRYASIFYANRFLYLLQKKTPWNEFWLSRDQMITKTSYASGRTPAVHK